VNGQSKQPAQDVYGGGSLVFYGLLDGSQWEKVGFPLEGEPGLLIAFRSDLLHEVQQVTFGHRYTVVSWFTS
jgi:predicted 2-oxoglutarate/Fe(II)-dependent dioxygenase YbiX